MKRLAAIVALSAGLLVFVPLTFAAPWTLYLPQQAEMFPFPSPGDSSLNVKLYLPAQAEMFPFPSPGDSSLNVKLYIPASDQTATTTASPQDEMQQRPAHEDILQ
jgi:hypothetical protein